MKEAIWKPTTERIAHANLTAFMRLIERVSNARIKNYEDLYSYSIAHPEKFWTSVWDFCEILSESRGDRVVSDFDQMPGAMWFPDARLNLAENLLRRCDEADAIVSLSELRDPHRLSFRQLQQQVSRTRQALVAANVQSGDRIAGYLPNVAETIIAMLATTSIGAIWCACSLDFGVDAAADRFSETDITLLITADGYPYNGQCYHALEKIKELVNRLPTIRKVVVVNNIENELNVDHIPGAVTWETFLAPYSAQEIEYQRFPFNHPAFILYSSGTTGAPKCIVHGAGGTLIENLKGQMLHFDVKSGDRVFWWTTTGWVVWHLMVFSLGCGATIILYDGSPTYPSSTACLDIAAAEEVTFLRLSPKLVDEMRKSGAALPDPSNLKHLKTITAAGAPFSADGYEFIYKKVKSDVHLASPSGGTDPMASIVSGNPIGPVYPGEIQVRALGFKAEIYNERGQSVSDEAGELVITMPFPSMPLGFWNDPDGRNFRASYFSVYPNTWYHGDWAEITPRGGVIIHGRSDATLNARGIRIGTAEIYRELHSFPEIVDSVVVSQDWNGSTRTVLFVVLREVNALENGLANRIRERLRINASPRHVPDRIIEIPDIPRTGTGKISEIAVREAIHGREVKNREALQNPEALIYFAPERIPEIYS